MIYLDNNATTRVADEVVAAMAPFYSEAYGNPHSPHALGRRSLEAIEQAREQVARFLRSDPEEIFFTSCGTESNALVIHGLLQDASRRKIVAASVEHPSVLSLLDELQRRGLIELALIPVDGGGAVDLQEARRLIDDDTLLVCAMQAQNETGVIHPIAEVSRLARERGARILVDAVQAAGKIDFDPQLLGVDFASFSGHKFHAPKGIGALYVRRGLTLPPLWLGGGQERGLRSGTEAVPLIAGLGAASRVAMDQMAAQGGVERLRDRLQQRIGGVAHGSGARLPNTLNVSLPGVTAAGLVAALDRRGVCVSGGSACHSGKAEPTAVMRAMSVPNEVAIGAVRFSLSRYTTADEIERAADAVLDALRELQPQETT